jgi:hypothetical protein
VGTAWCSYQSAAWMRQGNRLMQQANVLDRRAGLVTLQGTQMVTIHAGMFMQLLAARQAGNEKLAEFYAQRFPPDVRKAYDQWLAQKPFENPAADPHPFVPNLYQLRGADAATEMSRQAEEKLQQARAAGNRSGQYLGNTVLFATVLFFAGTTSKFEQRRVRVVAFIFALAVFAFALGRTLLFPMA